METMSLEAAVNEISQALATLEVAKEECKDVVEATLDAYFGEIQAKDKKEFKEIKASRKTEAKNIKKLAKAIIKGEKDVARGEADNMTSLIEELG
jgi:hypothetical protein